MEQALAQSINTPAVRLLLRAGGPAAVAAVAHRLGIADRLPERCRRWRSAPARSACWRWPPPMRAFFNGGVRVTPNGIETLDLDGRAAAATPARRR